MQKFEKMPFINTASLLLRRLFILSVIVAVAVLAVFWESLPKSVNSVVNSLSGDCPKKDDDNLIPHKFRLEKDSEISDNIPLQSPYNAHSSYLSDVIGSTQAAEIEYSNTIADNTALDDVTLAQLHEELKQLGAIACQLTYWGDKRNMFRFSCQVPVDDHNPIAIRTFQSINPDAARSMQEVIDQVRQWQTTLR